MKRVKESLIATGEVSCLGCRSHWSSIPSSPECSMSSRWSRQVATSNDQDFESHWPTRRWQKGHGKPRIQPRWPNEKPVVVHPCDSNSIHDLIWQVGPSSSPKPRLKVRNDGTKHLEELFFSCKVYRTEKTRRFSCEVWSNFHGGKILEVAATTSEVSEVVNGKSHKYWCSACLL